MRRGPPRMHADACRLKRGGVSGSNHNSQRGACTLGSGLAVTVLLLPFCGYGLAGAGG